jgi:hypothetical protein
LASSALPPFWLSVSVTLRSCAGTGGAVVIDSASATPANDIRLELRIAHNVAPCQRSHKRRFLC